MSFRVDHVQLPATIGGLPAIRQRLRDARIPVERQHGAGGDAILVEDPFGNRLELIGSPH